MTRYSIQPRYQIFQEAMDFCLLLKKWVKILVKV